MSRHPIKLSAVVPCYNEEHGLSELFRRLSAACSAAVGDAYEIVVVNDGSTDGTWPALKAMAASDSHVVAISLSRNFGHQIALSAGLEMCKGARVFILDADLQDPPELLPEFTAQMDQGYDVVFGQRTRREGETEFKRATAFLFYRLINRLSDTNIPPDTGDFRLMSRRATDILNSMPEHHRFIRGMVSWIGLRQGAVLYERAPRLSGKSKYPLAKMARFAMDAITGFSVRPLRVASYMGVLSSIAAFMLLIYVLVHYFVGVSVRGWTSLAVIVLMLGGAQMLVAGIIGEYLGRLYVESKRRPLFVIEEIVGTPAPDSELDASDEDEAQ